MYSVFVCTPSQAQTQPGLVGHSRQSASGAGREEGGREGGQLAALQSYTPCGALERPANCWENCVVVVMEVR